MICPIKIKTEEDVVRISDVVMESGLDISVSCDNVMVDPRSILSLFAFVGKDAILVASDDLNPNYFMKLVKKMGVEA